MELMKNVRCDGAFMFKYSPREHTPAWKMGDSVPDGVKTRRLQEIIELQNEISKNINTQHIGETVEVLIEGESKKSKDELMGRTDTNKVVVFPRSADSLKPGMYVSVRIVDANSATLFGTLDFSQQDTLADSSAVTDSLVHRKEMV
jgi:tRNA-2-methylthio-N6-dimethylallyladenosine synthase